MRFTTRPELAGTFGMVASTHWLASAAGMRALERGGNAFDAAVTAGFVLQVVEPHLNGLGGEVPIILQEGGGDTTHVIAGQGPAPRAASSEAFTELGLDAVPGTGLLAACVPAAFDAWMRLLGEFGTMPLREVLEPAIGYAAGGYPVVPQISAAIAGSARLFTDEWTESARVYLPDGKVPAPGSRFRNPDLAHTYERLLTEAENASTDRDEQIQAARDAFYRGFVAEAIGGFVQTPVLDTSGRRHAGLLDAADLAVLEVPLEAPVSVRYAGYEVCKAGPWSQGPVFLQQLMLLRGFDLDALSHNSADYIHTVVECAKLAFADREAWYGDPDFVDVPLDALLSEEYQQKRRGLVGDRASFELRPGSPDGRAPYIPTPELAAAEGAGAGEPTLADDPPGDTCHVDVVDRHGNVVSATPSGAWLQSSPVIPGMGFCLGSRAQMFWLVDGLPNSLAPAKRPRTTLTPTLVRRGNEPVMALGTPGGDMQDQWSLTFFLALVHAGLGLQEAIDAPMFHTDHVPSSFFPRAAAPGSLRVEGRLPTETVAELRARGHDVTVDGDWSLGRLAAVSRDPDNGLLRAAANPRGMQGYAVGR